MPRLTCPAAEQLRDFSTGRLADDSASSIGEHLDECPVCREAIERLIQSQDGLLAALRERETVALYSEETEYHRALQFVAAIGHTAVSLPQGSAPREPASPARRLRDYELLEKLGEGGMGAVYKARHVKLKRIVAIKVLPSDRLSDAGAVARFEREMEAVGRLDHPHIVRAMDAGEFDGTHFLVMEYVAGMDLSQLVRQHGPLPVREACELIRQAAIGLQEAHEHGMVHRDIKPSNIMLAVGQAASLPGKQPTVKILDMGLALLSEAHSADARNLTTTGQMMGTIDYMAPEQGGDSHQVDIRADLYSLGATLYKLLTGEAIYQGAKLQTPVQKLMALATQPAPPLLDRRPDAPPALAALVARLLAKDPNQRPATPGEVATALAPLAAGASLQSLLVNPLAAASPTAPALSEPTRSTTEMSNEVTTDLARVEREGEAPAEPVPQPRPRSPRGPRPLVAAAALGGLALVAALGLVFYLQTPDGTIKIEVSDKDVQVALDATGAKITGADGTKEFVHVQPGPHGLRITRGDFKFDTKQFELKKGETTTVKVEFLAGQVRVFKDNEPLGSPTPLPAATPPAGAGDDRRVAEWVLKSGGNVSLDGQHATIRGAAAQLPAVPFKLTGIHFEGGNVKQADLMDNLRGLAHLDRLSLANVSTTDADVQALASLPNLSGSLHNLWIFSDKFTDAGLPHLKQLAKLENLEVRSPLVTDAGLAHIRELPNLFSFWVQGQISDAGLAELRGAKIRWLVILGDGQDPTASKNKSVTDAGLAHLRELSLDLLNLQDCSVSDRGLLELQKFPCLINLTLARTKVTDAGLATLAEMPKLTSLDLSGNFTDVGIGHLKGMPALTNLAIRNAPITDAGLESLQSLTSLQGLSLQHTNVTQAGAEKLAAALPNCSITTDSGTIAASAADRAVAEWALASGGWVMVNNQATPGPELPTGPVRLRGLNVTTAMLADLPLKLRPLEHLESLHLHGVPLNDADLEKLAAVPNLSRTLKTLIFGSDQATDTGLAHVAKFSQLETLDARSLQFTDQGLAHVSKLPKLIALALLGSFTDEGLRNLQGSQLRSLILFGDRRFNEKVHNRGITNAGLGYLRGSQLALLALSDSSVDDAGLPQLAEFPLLNQLSLTRSKITDNGLKTLAAMSKLTSLDLAGPFTDAGAAHLSGRKNLYYLAFREAALTDAGVAHLGTLTQLHGLSLEDLPITDAALEHLRSLADLQGLHLLRTKVSPAGVEKLARALPNCPITTDSGTVFGRTLPLPIRGKEKPFVLVRGGQPAGEFKTLPGLLSEMRAGDEVEIHGDGPYKIGPVNVEGQGLTLRAASGYRPRLEMGESVVPQDSQAVGVWFTVRGGPLTIEGCDLVGTAPANLLRHAGGPLLVRRCRLLHFSCLGSYEDGPEVTVEECLISSHYGLSVQSPRATLTMRRCVANSIQDLFTVRGGTTVLLERNTIQTMGVVVVVNPVQPDSPSTIELRNNLVSGIVFGGQPALVYVADKDWQPHVRWKGRGNVYAGSLGTPHVLPPGGPAWKATEATAWDQVLAGESQSQRVPAVEFAWQAAGRALTVVSELEGALAAARRLSGLADVGPDLKRLGPGAAYVAALSQAAGQPLAKDRLRLEAEEGGPFVQLRGGAVLRGFNTLADALTAAASGDVIEIRTDGPRPAATVPVGKGRLTIRAAPGYRPVLTGDLGVGEGNELTLAGVHLHGNLGGGSETALVAEIRNCLIEGHLYVRTSAQQPAQVVHSAVQSLACYQQEGGRTTLVHSAVNHLDFAAPAGESALALDHSAIWHPHHEHPFAIHPSVLGLRTPTIVATDSLFEAGCMFCNLPALKWSGDRNYYRIAMNCWQYARSDANGLPAWRKAFGSDANSAAGDSLLDSPAAWRVAMPALADSTAGADVLRLAAAFNVHAEREVAEFVLGQGGLVEVVHNGTHVRAAKLSELPPEPFQITYIEIDNTRGDDRLLERFSTLSGLQLLGLVDPHLTDESLSRFARSPAGAGLWGININQAPLTDACLPAFKNSRELRNISIVYGRLSGTGFAALRDLPLWSVVLEANPELSPAGLAEIAKLKQLTMFYIGGCPQVTDDALAELKETTTLTRVSLQGNRVSGAGLRHLAKNAELVELSLTGTQIIDADLPLVAGFIKLSSLNVGALPITDAGLAKLRMLSQMKLLILSGTKISDAGLAHLSGMPLLNELDLRTNPGVTDQGLESLRESAALRVVRLNGTAVTEAGVKRLAAALPKCAIEWDGGTLKPTAQ